MHDVGKIGIPDAILLKPGKLDREEWEVMKEHTTIGARILSGSSSDVLRAGQVIAHLPPRALGRHGLSARPARARTSPCWAASAPWPTSSTP